MPESATREIFGNIDGVSKGVFYAIALAAMICFGYGVWRRVRLWRLGRPGHESIDWRMTLAQLATRVLTQRTFASDRRGASLAHRLLFWGFGVLFIGTVLVAVEHVTASALRRPYTDPVFHKGVYYLLFETTLDAFGLAFLAGAIWFAVRRAKGPGSMAHRPSDWLVIGSLIAIGVSGYWIEGARILREQPPLAGFSFVGYGCAEFLALVGVDRESAAPLHFTLWWLHAVAALGFIAAFPYCRLLHAIAGAISVSTSETKLGTMTPISIEEVEETGVVGVERVEEFTRRQLVELDACVACGRCQDQCPAYEAGKPLSPRDVVQDIRRHLEDRFLTNSATAALHGDVISAETLWSCTTCNACVDVCPLGVRPLKFITDMRRHLIGEGQLRGAAATSLQKMQRSGNPWGLPSEERLNWAEGLDVPTVKDNPGFDVLYWVGCAAAYDRRTMKVARAVAQLLHRAGVNFAVLGPEERCTGESARRMGDEFLFQELAQTNIDTFEKHNVTTIVTHCPHCLNSLTNDYPQFGGNYEILHHSQFLADLVRAGKLNVSPQARRKITFHDPCYLARVQGIVDPPRELIQIANPGDGAAVAEMPRRGRNTACCGAGGGRMWLDDTPAERIGGARIDEALATGADTVAVACPFCLTMIGDGAAANGADVDVRDIAEILLECGSPKPGIQSLPTGSETRRNGMN